MDFISRSVKVLNITQYICLTTFHLRYNVPRSFLKPTGNLLVLLEENGWNPLQISLDTVSISQVWGHVTASHLASVSSWIEHNHRAKNPAKISGRRPKVLLACPSKSKISRISFASYGTPLGNCRSSLAVGTCHPQNSTAVVKEVSHFITVFVFDIASINDQEF